MIRLLFSFLTILSLTSLSGLGVDINVSSYGTGDGVTEADVESAITASSVGDRIILSAGTATWTGVTLTTGRTLRGAGAGLTTINTTAAASSMLIINTDCIVEDITFYQNEAVASSSAVVISTGSAQNVIIRNCEVLNIKGRGIVAGSSVSSPHPTGVVYNCTISADPDLVAAAGTFQLFTTYGGDNNYPPFANTNAGSWAFDPGAGTGDMFYVEDCIIEQEAQGDSTSETYYGGKICFRYNTCKNFEMGVHGRDSSLRSGHWYEVYNNTITNTLGSNHIGLMTSRGGSGVIWGNTITGSGGNGLTLQSYRSAGQLAVDQPNYLSRFSYGGGQLDGSDFYDGNTAIYTGTHDGSNGTAVLSDSTQSWGTDEMEGAGDFAITNNLQSYFLWNRTKKVGGRIIANTATTATVDRFVYAETETALTSPTPETDTSWVVHTNQSSLFPATPFDMRVWRTGLDSSTPGNYEIVTVTAVSGKNLTVVRAQAGTTALATGGNLSVEGGARLTWDAGDEYVITNGYPGLDQNGWTGPTVIYDNYSTQTLSPWYEWDNTYNGSTAAVTWGISYMDSGHTTIAQPDTAFMLQENREYYNDTPKPGYTPYTYPHPLRGSASVNHSRIPSAARRSILLTR